MKKKNLVAIIICLIAFIFIVSIAYIFYSTFIGKECVAGKNGCCRGLLCTTATDVDCENLLNSDCYFDELYNGCRLKGGVIEKKCRGTMPTPTVEGE